jgi:hypothetical protein
LVDETGTPRENHRPATSLTEKLYHMKFYPVYLSIEWNKTHNVCGDRC